MKRRRATPEEMCLWNNEIKSVTPLSLDQKKALFYSTEPSKKFFKTKINIKEVQKSKMFGTVSMAPSQKFGRKELRHVVIEARLDMHGMTLEEGFLALESFLQRAHERGLRTVLIITGKGALNSSNTLRRYLPRWVEDEAIRNFVSILHYPAKACDGGYGAFYIKIKRPRK